MLSILTLITLASLAASAPIPAPTQAAVNASIELEFVHEAEPGHAPIKNLLRSDLPHHRDALESYLSSSSCFNDFVRSARSNSEDVIRFFRRPEVAAQLQANIEKIFVESQFPLTAEEKARFLAPFVSSIQENLFSVNARLIVANTAEARFSAAAAEGLARIQVFYFVYPTVRGFPFIEPLPIQLGTQTYRNSVDMVSNPMPVVSLESCFLDATSAAIAVYHSFHHSLPHSPPLLELAEQIRRSRRESRKHVETQRLFDDSLYRYRPEALSPP